MGFENWEPGILGGAQDLLFLKRDSGPQYDQVELGTQDCTVETRDPGFQKFQVEAGTRDP